MARIKSAWEIALERTENIEIDEKKLAFDEDMKKARAIAGRYLNAEEDGQEDIFSELQTISDKKAMKEGVVMTVIQNLNLPSETVLTDRYERIGKLADSVSEGNAQVNELMGQLIGFIKQYPEHRNQLVEQLKEQFAPMMQQKEEEFRAKYGQSVNLSPENDPEFVKIAQGQLDKLSKQYNETLEGAKAQLKAMLLA